MTSLDVIVTFSDNIILTKDTDRNASLIFYDSIYHFLKKKQKTIFYRFYQILTHQYSICGDKIHFAMF